MKLEFDGSYYVLTCPYKQKDVAKKNGFFFDPIIKKWKTSKLRNAIRLRKVMTEETRKRILGFICVNKPKSYSVSFPQKIVPRSEKLRPVQIKAVKFALDRSSSYLALEQGLGKTATAIAIINAMTFKKNIKALIVVTPNKVSDWHRDILRWQVVDYSIHICSSERKESINKSTHHIYLVSDTFIDSEEFSYLTNNVEFDLFINDEAHRFGSYDSNRTKALYLNPNALVRRAKKKVLLSGTPMGNKVKDIYPVLSSIAWNVIDFMDFNQFAMRYCAGFLQEHPGGYSINAEGASNIDELREKLSQFMLVEKFDDHESVVMNENLILIQDESGVEYINSKFTELNSKNAMSYLETDNALTAGGDIARLRREISKIKLKPSFKYILKKIKENPDVQFLVIGYHRDLIKKVYDSLHKKYKTRVGYIDGSVKAKVRDQICRSFQEGEVEIIVAQIETMVGTDLYKGSYGIFIEPHWSPRAIEQAKFRLKRIGQKLDVTFDYLVLKDTIEEYVLSNYFKKLKTINKTIRSVTNGETD